MERLSSNTNPEENDMTVDLKTDLIKALTRSDENFRALVEILPASLMVHRGSRIIYVNPSWLRLLGYDHADELIGQPPIMVVHPDYRKLIQDRISRIDRGQTATPLLEQVFIRKNGEAVAVEAEGVSVIYGGVPAVMVVARDISIRKKAQEALQQSDENLKAILEQIPDAVAVEYPDKILFVNQYLVRMLGYEKSDELVGRSPMDKVHPDYHSILAQRIDRVYGKEGKNPLLEYKLLKKDGSTIDVEVSSVSITYGGKRAIIAIGRDVSERKKAEELLRKTERQALLNDKLTTVGTLAAGVAHEINNPLTYVLANIASVKEHLGELRDYLAGKNMMDSRVFSLMNDLQEEAKDTDGGIGRIRDIARTLKSFMHSGGDETAEINVNELMDSAINMVFHEIKRKAKLEKAYAVYPPFLKMNPGKLQQVLINLLMNAAQAIEPNQMEHNRIRVGTGVEGGNVLVEIQDTGQGVPDENLKRIFDPFFTTKPAGIGTGLGLSICHQIIHGYGGQILVRSRVGQGTTFTLLLPSVKPNLVISSPEAAVASPAARKKILVVDDEPANVDTFGRMLRKEHEVLFASSGLDALGILEREKQGFDAIVSDVNMATWMGWGFIKIFAKNTRVWKSAWFS